MEETSVPEQVSPESFGRFVGHLDPILQHRDREDGGGVGGQPQPERVAGGVGVCDHLVE